MVSGASSQWADTTRIDFGRGSAADQAASWPGQVASSVSVGAPWPRYRVGIRSAMVGGVGISGLLMAAALLVWAAGRSAAAGSSAYAAMLSWKHLSSKRIFPALHCSRGI